jgi:hypothetical protein
MEDKLDALLVENNEYFPGLPFYLNAPYVFDDPLGLIANTGPGNKQKWLYKDPVKPLYNCGRNEPCPCGSGTKYKKCCINKTQ